MGRRVEGVIYTMGRRVEGVTHYGAEGGGGEVLWGGGGTYTMGRGGGGERAEGETYYVKYVLIKYNYTINHIVQKLLVFQQQIYSLYK